MKTIATFVAANRLGGSALNTTHGDMRSPNERLWFRQPARYWNSQALHLGNGHLGASFWGGVGEERIDLTERTLWTGGPGEFSSYHYGISEEAGAHLQEIRELICSNEIGKLKEADSLVSQHFTGDDRGFGAFSTFGKLAIETPHDFAQTRNYVRELDLATGIGAVEYSVGGVRYKREYLCSNPHRILAIRIAGDREGSVQMKVRWSLLHTDHRVEVNGNTLQVTGAVNGNHRRFSITLRIVAEKETVTALRDGLEVHGANAVVLLVGAATEYRAQDLNYGGANPIASTQGQCDAAAAIGFERIRSTHVSDYQGLFNRVSLSVPRVTAAERLPTDERWRRYRDTRDSDPGIKALYFNFGRYLLISSSRPGGLPNNLQGGWNAFAAAPWSGNYQSNINLQLSYSGAAITNLAECQEPYISWINNLVGPGRAVAKAYYGTEGWVSHSIGNIWGYAAPGAEITWGMYPAAAAWHCHTLWEHFVYSQDKQYLAKTAYPVMKEAAEFWLANLVPYQDGLISAPSVSAEHGASLIDGHLAARGSSFDAPVHDVPGCYQDIEIVRDLLTNTAAAAQVLRVDDDFISRVNPIREKLLPLRIGKYRQLQEWAADIDSPECNHRHISHTYAVWPARQVTPFSTPELAAAAKRSLLMRGSAHCDSCGQDKDVHTAGNWSLANRIWCWVRLQDGERANAIFTDLITTAGFENLCTFQHVPNDYAPSGDTPLNNPDMESTPKEKMIWQVDASMATPGFIAEMLVQMSNEVLHLLPALPKEWAIGGSVRGLCAPGGLTVDLAWKHGAITSLKLASASEREVVVRMNGRVQNLKTLPLNGNKKREN